MKTKSSRLITVPSLAAGCALISLVGCAEMESSNTKSLLSAAGFRVRTPETAQQKAIYQSLPAYKVERATVHGKVFYVFKDEKAGIAYVGREAEYQRYRDLAVRQQIAQDYYMAVEMNRATARGWYGAWGLRGMY